MNILLISQVYPAFPGQSPQKVSYALHHLVRYWLKKEELLVVRPYFLPHTGGENRSISRLSFSLDGVDILTRPFLKIPRTPLICMTGLYNKLEKINFPPQVVVAHVGYGLSLGYKIAKRYNSPLVAAVHYGDLVYGEKLLGKKRISTIYESATAIACRSQAVYHGFIKRYPRLRERCFTAYSGIAGDIIEDKEFGPGKLQQWKKQDRGPIRFLSACSLLPLKNLDINLQALAKLDPSIEWTYRVAGNGPEKERLEKLSRKLGIERRVHFLGHLSRQGVLEEMAASHIFLMVSAPETFGLAYLEALAKGNIVIGARGYGIDGVVVHGKNGFLCPPRDEGALSLVLENILDSLTTRQLTELLHGAHDTITQYTEEKAAANYLEQIGKYTIKK